MNWALAACFILLPVCIFGQSFSFPKFNGPVKSVTELVRSKWTLKDSVSGDLNADQRPDMAVVLEYADTVTEWRGDSIENTARPRILLVLLWDTALRAYKVNVQNNTFLLRSGEGGMVDDPYAGINITNGVFELVMLNGKR